MEKIRVSYSSLATFASCARKFEFDKIYPRLEKSGDWYAADVGSALHAGYQHYMTHQDADAAVWTFMQAFPFESEFTQSNDYRGFEASLSTLERMIDETAMNEYRLAEIRTPSGEVKPAIEVPFELTFKGVGVAPCPLFPEGAEFAFTGFIDAITQHAMTGLYRTTDIKTTRMQLNDATPKFKFDTQQVPYGIVVDHVAQGEVDSFEVLYMDCYIDLLNPSVNLYSFMKSNTDIQEWVTNKVIQLQAMARFIEGDYFPRTDTGCLFYNRPCRYMEPCQSRDREALTQWFLMGGEPAADRPFEPWIVADLDVGA